MLKTCKSSMLDFRIYSFLSSEKPEEDPKPSTWCEKVPKKICAPDFCEMVAGPKECHDKTISSTVVKPEEVCDLQPSTQCRLVTNLVPHLVPQQVCKDIPKEVCHLKLDDPRIIKKPVTLRYFSKIPIETRTNNISLFGYFELYKYWRVYFNTGGAQNQRKMSQQSHHTFPHPNLFTPHGRLPHNPLQHLPLLNPYTPPNLNLFIGPLPLKHHQ